MKQIITGIRPGSVSEKLNIEPGDELLSVNGSAVQDVFDYQYLANDAHIELEIRKSNGETERFFLEKDPEEDLGLEFGEGLMDDYKSCSNKCIFCFIDQMPPGMRDTLYFKDDDSRLSFLQGNYITLTNMKQADIDRIIRYRMEPINISVHTTDPDLRVQMLHNRFAGDVLLYLDDLSRAGIKMNGQIVLCKGINDGDHLKQTIEDLSRYLPYMESVSIVPVGLTKFRDGLYPMQPFTKKDALTLIDTVESYQMRFYEEFGLHFVHLSDEFYILAGKDVPEEETYDGYLQLENGVGMLRLLCEEFYEELDLRSEDPEDSTKIESKRQVSIATGMLAAPFIQEFTGVLMQRYPNIRVNVFSIQNDFFGNSITVSGLVCGCDLKNQLKGKDLGEELLIPVNMLRTGEQYFLDDVTVSELEQTLHTKITVVPRNGDALVAAILGEPFEMTRRQIYEQADCSDCWQA